MAWVSENFSIVFAGWRADTHPDADLAIEVGLNMRRVEQDPEDLAETSQPHDGKTLCAARMSATENVWLLYALSHEADEDIVAAIGLGPFGPA